MRGSSRGEFTQLVVVAGEEKEVNRGQRFGTRKQVFAILASGIFLAALCAGRAGVFASMSPVQSRVKDVVQESLQRCGRAEKDIDFVYDVLAGVGHVDNVASYQECCAICKAEPECQAYTWVKDAKLVTGNPGQCWLKGGLFVSKTHKSGVYSAFAGMNELSTEEDEPTEPKTKKTIMNLRVAHKEPHSVSNVEAEVKALKSEDVKKEDARAKALATARAKAEEKQKEEEQAKEIEDAEQAWAEKMLKKKAEKLAERLANEKAEEELMRKANALAKSKAEELAENLAKEEEEADKQPQMNKIEPAGLPEVDDRYKDCAGLGEGCLKSKCCRNRGNQCFTKNAWWAQCMPECSKGPNPVDQVSPMPWECDALGDRTPGDPEHCALDGENCMGPKCCMKGGTTCFAKNSTWGECKASCSPGPDLFSDDSQAWTCDKLGTRTVGAAPWVATKCASNGQDCSKQACCKEPNHQCYKQDNFYSECKPTCMQGEKLHAWDKAWNCETVGSRTPAVADDEEEAVGKVGKWVEKTCAGSGDNCLNSQCCLGVKDQCFTKNEFWAACKQTCTSEPDPEDNNATWACKPLGPVAMGLPIKGYPSLYCITLYMPSSYEGGLIKYHLDVDGGIFACDGFDIYAAEPDTLGTSKDGIVVEAIQIPKIKVGKSQDGTAGNAKLFMAVWDKVIAGGRFRNYDWTIKVDADAVMLPWRVRNHMRPHVGKKVYVVNCNKYPDSPNFPMMYGSMEIFSGPAMAAYAKSSWKCGKELPWHEWGEDFFMTKCMDYVGVDRISDFGVIGDNVCTGANCADSYTGAFHPFKSVETWKECWETATAGGRDD